MRARVGVVSDDVGERYDRVAELYASLFLDELERDHAAVEWLGVFAERTRGLQPVADLGCGPGHVVDHLAGRGVEVVGIDASPGQLAEARRAFPDHEFQLGDLRALDAPDRSFGGIVSRYSIIHLHPADLGRVFTEWNRVVEPGAPILLSFFGSTSPAAHGTPFDHQVTTAYELWPNEVARQLRECGFVDAEIGVAPPAPGSERPYDRAHVLARSGGNGTPGEAGERGR